MSGKDLPLRLRLEEPGQCVGAHGSPLTRLRFQGDLLLENQIQSLAHIDDGLLARKSLAMSAALALLAPTGVCACSLRMLTGAER
eukprot:CAMPEP_0202114008 /NCGR_PEP_ID=MMETSP0965-20130614/35240_1 /ASSEMBLY_ACC=CAM_ASM_000507 /TAXON_ID=4773 /ORGANISM="Schizochytrium aggregatum, Strain ATCC28209" /LENGTH=84 /DNA_ID=CAMNT_0048683679 /DNA_START=175 /DNA_END=426 /DNA_ORIENTATION=-